MTNLYESEIANLEAENKELKEEIDELREYGMTEKDVMNIFEEIKVEALSPEGQKEIAERLRPFFEQYNQAKLAILKKNVEKIKKRFEYGIKCKICGDELTLGYSQNMMWGCSYLENDPKDDDKSRRKIGRNVADDHFYESRVCMSFETKKINESVIKILNDVIKLIEGMK